MKMLVTRFFSSVLCEHFQQMIFFLLVLIAAFILFFFFRFLSQVNFLPCCDVPLSTSCCCTHRTLLWLLHVWHSTTRVWPFLGLWLVLQHEEWIYLHLTFLFRARFDIWDFGREAGRTINTSYSRYCETHAELLRFTTISLCVKENDLHQFSYLRPG